MSDLPSGKILENLDTNQKFPESALPFSLHFFKNNRAYSNHTSNKFYVLIV